MGQPLDHSMEREGRPQKRPRGSHLEEGEIEEDEEPVKNKARTYIAPLSAVSVLQFCH